MAWTPPKKKISPEKAMALARQRATPLWLRSKAHFWPEQEAPTAPIQLRVLEPEFSKTSMAFAFFDPSSEGGSALGVKFKALFERYAELGIEFYCVVPAPATQAEYPPDAKAWFQHQHWGVPGLADAGGLLGRLWGIPADVGGFVVLKNGSPEQVWNPALDSLKSFELRFQSWLRTEDPGLPLIDPQD